MISCPTILDQSCQCPDLRSLCSGDCHQSGLSVPSDDFGLLSVCIDFHFPVGFTFHLLSLYVVQLAIADSY